MREADQGFLSVGLLVLFTALVAFGNAVAVSVTEEKSSRVVELLLTTMSPRRLLTGKVLGIGLLGVAQLSITGAAALAAGHLAGGAGLPSGAIGTVALVVLWFLLGYAFYSVAYAAAGALVSRQEDLLRRVGSDHRRPRGHLLALDAGRRLRSGTQHDGGADRGVRAADCAHDRPDPGGRRRHGRARAVRRGRT